MNRSEANHESSPCAQVASDIEKLLNGELTALSAAHEDHRRICTECAAMVRAAAQLQRGLSLMSAPTVPDGFSNRVVSAVLADGKVVARRRTQRVRSFLLVTLAASVLLALGGVWALSEAGPLHKLIVRETPAPTPVEPPNTVAKDSTPAPPISLRDSLQEASTAVASLTRRTADETMAPTRKLISSQIEAPSLVAVDELPKAIDPAAQSLQEVRQGAAAGLEPMAASARRAFSMFLREVPPAAGERKSDF